MPALLNNTSYKFMYGGSEYNAYLNGNIIFSNPTRSTPTNTKKGSKSNSNDDSSKRLVTITINPTPSDAIVTLIADDFIQSGNSITVDAGTDVTYTVSKTGYITKTDTLSSTVNQYIEVSLDIQYVTLTIDTIPSDAIVTFSTGNYSSQSSKNITVPYNTYVNYTVSKSGMNSAFGSEILTNNITRNIALTYPIILCCDNKELDEYNSYIMLGNKVDLIYKWCYPTFKIYKDDVLVYDSIKPNNTFNISGVLPGNAYRIVQTYKYIDWIDNNTIKCITKDFATGILPSNGLTINVDITTDFDNGSAMSSQYVNQANYIIYITT